MQGAEPLFVFDYIGTGKLSRQVADQIVEGLVAGCKLVGCALLGGETAEMPGMYPAGEYDLAGFAVGAVEKSKILTGHNVQEGDVIEYIRGDGETIAYAVQWAADIDPVDITTYVLGRAADDLHVPRGLAVATVFLSFIGAVAAAIVQIGRAHV